MCLPITATLAASAAALALAAATTAWIGDTRDWAMRG